MRLLVLKKVLLLLHPLGVLTHVILFATLLHATSPLQTDFKNKASKKIYKLLKQSETLSAFLSNHSMQKYYTEHQYHLFWFDENGTKPIAIDLVNTILNDPVLKPISRELFQLNKTMMLMSEIEATVVPNIAQMVHTDFIITGIYDNYMRLLAQGSLDWKAFESALKVRNEEERIVANWERHSIHKNRRTLLYKACETKNIYTAINAIDYTFPNAKGYVKVLCRYDRIANDGGYTHVLSFNK